MLCGDGCAVVLAATGVQLASSSRDTQRESEPSKLADSGEIPEDNAAPSMGEPHLSRSGWHQGV